DSHSLPIVDMCEGARLLLAQWSHREEALIRRVLTQSTVQAHEAGFVVRADRPEADHVTAAQRDDPLARFGPAFEDRRDRPAPPAQTHRGSLLSSVMWVRDSRIQDFERGLLLGCICIQ